MIETGHRDGPTRHLERSDDQHEQREGQQNHPCFGRAERAIGDVIGAGDVAAQVRERDQHQIAIDEKEGDVQPDPGRQAKADEDQVDREDVHGLIEEHAESRPLDIALPGQRAIQTVAEPVDDDACAGEHEPVGRQARKPVSHEAHEAAKSPKSRQNVGCHPAGQPFREPEQNLPLRLRGQRTDHLLRHARQPLSPIPVRASCHDPIAQKGPPLPRRRRGSMSGSDLCHTCRCRHSPCPHLRQWSGGAQIGIIADRSNGWRSGQKPYTFMFAGAMVAWCSAGRDQTVTTLVQRRAAAILKWG